MCRSQPTNLRFVFWTVKREYFKEGQFTPNDKKALDENSRSYYWEFMLDTEDIYDRRVGETGVSRFP